MINQVRNTIFAGLSGTVVLMAFANNLHDLVGRWASNPLHKPSIAATETPPETVSDAPATHDFHRFNPLAALTPVPTLHVDASGDDGNPGSADQPLKSLGEALQRVMTAQAETPNVPYLIQLGQGQFGDPALGEVLVVPPGVTIKGQGEQTRVAQALHLHHQARVETLSLENTGILIQPDGSLSGEVQVQGVEITNGFLAIKAPQASGIGQIQIDQVVLADSCLLVSGQARPQLTNLQLTGAVGVDEFSVANCSEQGLLATGTAVPLIQLLGAADLENIEINQANLALFNQSEGSVIKNLRIRNSLSGIDNTGQLNLEQVNLENIRYTGICNQGHLTLQRPQFTVDLPAAGEVCPLPGLDLPPVTPTLLAGNIAGITLK